VQPQRRYLGQRHRVEMAHHRVRLLEEIEVLARADDLAASSSLIVELATTHDGRGNGRHRHGLKS
jgi:hypothetical protein